MKIQVNGTTLFYKKVGAGSPLILLHGNGEDHHVFDKLSEKLKDDFTIYAIDSRNHGKSNKTGDYSYETMAEDIYEFIEKMGLGRVNILGFSDGAIISLFLAMKQTEVLNKMVLLGVNLSPKDFTEESYHLIEETYAKTKDPLFKLMMEEPNIRLDDLREIAVPTLIVAGEKDVFKPETFENLQLSLLDSRLIIMAGHDHDSYIVGQDILYLDLIHFLNDF